MSYEYSSLLENASLFVTGVIVPYLYSLLKQYKSNSELTTQLKTYAENLSLLEMVTILGAIAEWVKAGCPEETWEEVAKTIKNAVSS